MLARRLSSLPLKSIVASCWLLIALHLVLPSQVGAQQSSPPLKIDRNLLKSEIGRKLYYDPRCSLDGWLYYLRTGSIYGHNERNELVLVGTSCAKCHHYSAGYGDRFARTIGLFGQVGDNNAPTTRFASLQGNQFWNSRTESLKAQSLLPWTNLKEMGNNTREQVIDRLRVIPGNEQCPSYVALFAAAYGSDVLNSNFAQAACAECIEAFERTLTPPFDAPIDKYMAGDTEALTKQEHFGVQLLQAARCFECHTPTSRMGMPTFRDDLVHNNGSEFFARTGETGRFGVDRSLGAPTVRAVKTPSLRFVEKTAPYMSRGQFGSIEQVLGYYNTGGVRRDGQRDPFIDPRIQPMGLNASVPADRAKLEAMAAALKRPFNSSDEQIIKEPVLP